MNINLLGIHRRLQNQNRRLLSILTLLALTITSVFADSQFLIEAGRSDNTLGQHKDWWVYISGSFFQSSGNITPPGATPGIGSQFMTSVDAACELRPVMTTPGGTWLIEFAIPVTTLVEGTRVVLTQTGCSGLPATSTNFSSGDANVWRELGTITLDAGETMPVIGISWDETNETPPGFSNRVYPCEFRFTPVGEPCQNVPALPPVHGPLAEGQTYVDVAGVTNTASAVTVYADDGFGGAFTQIGQLTTGIVDGVNRVTTSALVRNAQVIASQTVDAQEGCLAGAGPKVGGGANPSIRVNFLLNEEDTFTGPIGAPGAHTAGPSLHALGSTGPVAGGYLFAPADGAVVSPSSCWQTVTFRSQFDPEYQVFAGTAPTPGNFATLSGLAFSIQDTADSGPFEIYVDNIVNGSTLIQDFEGPAAGVTDYFFSPPLADPTTAVYLLGAPNAATISTENADTGEKSSLVSFQFGTESSAAWTMLLSTGSNGLPQVDLSQPIQVRLLVLPVGQDTNILQVSALGKRTVVTNENVTLSVSVLRGTGPFSYQWKSNGVDIAGQTSASLTLNNVQLTDSADYSVVVTDGNSGCSTESFGLLTVTEVIPPPVLNYTPNGSMLELSWTDSSAVLQEATVLTGSPGDWSDVQGATSPYSVSTATGTKFFRLKR